MIRGYFGLVGQPLNQLVCTELDRLAAQMDPPHTMLTEWRTQLMYRSRVGVLTRLPLVDNDRLDSKGKTFRGVVMSLSHGNGVRGKDPDSQICPKIMATRDFMLNGTHS